MALSPPIASVCLLAFDGSNRLAVRIGSRQGGAVAPVPGAPTAHLSLAFLGSDLPGVLAQLEAVFPAHTEPVESFETDDPAGTSSAGPSLGRCRVFLTQVRTDPTRPVPGIIFRSVDSLEAGGSMRPGAPDLALAAVLRGLEPHLIGVPYLHLGENDFIYKFRPERERNPSIYGQDEGEPSLYRSRLCQAVKALARRHERTATAAVTVDFGPVRYILPSHFGFCLGVKNAIDRAYETLLEHPAERVFMLSELIHNPFVNEDLLRRGLRYLQTDKGVPYRTDGRAGGPPDDPVPFLWDALTSDDIVIIPAFGATDDDKRRLIRKGIAVCQYDATCMLVEKVWKAARAYGRDGYTVVIHGKHEHEETKATFSNTQRHAPAVIVRNLEETRLLAEIIAAENPSVRARFYTLFAGKHTPGFDVDRHLSRVAVVNQTTLLVNETREIIAYLREVLAARFGPDRPGEPARVGGQGRNDTLCYATQVNQDALGRALEEPLDAAFVIGGKNSSNTYQLYRLCEQKLGERAYFIQSEADIVSPTAVEHFVFPAKGGANRTERRSLDLRGSPARILVTGGASCPDGIIRQVIARINGYYPAGALRSGDAVLGDLSPV